MVVRFRGFIRGVRSGWDGVDILRGVPSGRVEMNFGDDVASEGSDQERSEPGQPGGYGRNQRKES